MVVQHLARGLAMSLGMVVFVGIVGPTGLVAQAGAESDPLTVPYPAADCGSCAVWNEPQAPFQVFGDTYYVGTRGLTAILITSPAGHVLIDGALPNSAPLILANIRDLGFDPAEIAVLLNTPTHFDHAGGLAAIERATGARAVANEASATALESGQAGPEDPQYDIHLEFPALARPVERIADGGTLEVGPLALTAHVTAGHTAGGTTWAWISCEDGTCYDMVYADSLSPASADGFRFLDSPVYRSAVEDFERGFATLERIDCDILMTPHPGQSLFWGRVEGGIDSLVDADACTRYAANGRALLERRLATEASGR